MSFTRAKCLPGILLFIDFEKAFDSLEWYFLKKCLKLFNFGPDLINWVNTFYKNAKSCRINHGLCFRYFNVERGVREGDPLSPYFFVICVEILPSAVRNDVNSKGFKISDSETKLLQFADEITAILADLNSIQALLKLLNDCEKVSGLQLSIMKTEVMWYWISSKLWRRTSWINTEWKTCVKLLGIFITLDVKILVDKTLNKD